MRAVGHRGAISWWLLATATALAAGGCGGGAAGGGPGAGAPGTATGPVPGVPPGRTVPLGELFVLEAWGAAPGDTALAIVPGRARTIVLRHGPPDNTVFVELRLPAGLFGEGAPDSVRIALRPRPGIYGVDVESTPAFGRGAVLVFKYPVHFSAPQGARTRYRGAVAYERALGIGRVAADGRVVFLASTRPASDNLAAELPGPGRYLVAAPR